MVFLYFDADHVFHLPTGISVASPSLNLYTTTLGHHIPSSIGIVGDAEPSEHDTCTEFKTEPKTVWEIQDCGERRFKTESGD